MIFETKIKSKPLIKGCVVFQIERKKLKIHYAVFIDSILRQYEKEATKLAHAMKNFEKTKDVKQLDLVGEATVSLIQLIFGEEDADKIFKFYENRYLQLINDITPFLTEKIVPALRKR